MPLRHAIIEYNKCYPFWLQYFVFFCLCFCGRKRAGEGKGQIFLKYLLFRQKQKSSIIVINPLTTLFQNICASWQWRSSVLSLFLILVLDISACRSQSTARQPHTPSCVQKPFPHSLQSALVPSFTAVKEGQQIWVLRSVGTQVLQKIKKEFSTTGQSSVVV